MGFFQNQNLMRVLDDDAIPFDPMPLRRIMPPGKNPDGLPGGGIDFSRVTRQVEPQAGFDAGMNAEPDLTRYRRATPGQDDQGYTDAATMEKNLQRVGSQPFVPVSSTSRELPFTPINADSQQGGYFARQGSAPKDSIPFEPMPVQGEKGFFAMNPEVNAANLERMRRFVPEPSTVEAEDAPLDLTFERVRNKDFMHPVVDEGLRSGDAATRSAALSDAGVPLDIQRVLKQTDRPEMPNHKGEKRGFWANFGHRLEHAGKGALLGLAEGGAGGGIMGAIMGGASPEMADRMEYNRVTLPRWKQENDYDTKQNAARMNIADDYARVSGVNPYTGQPTATANAQNRNYGLAQDKFEEAQDNADRRYKQQDYAAKQRDRGLSLREQGLAKQEKQSRINTLLNAAKIPGRKFDADTKAEIEDAIGATLPDEFNPQIHSIKMANDGTFQIVNIPKDGGAVTTAPVIDSKTGKPMKGMPPQINMPQYISEGQAKGQILRERGITDPNQLVNNPAFADAVQREMEADKAAAAGRGVAPSTQAQIERRVENRLKIKRRVRAGDLVSDDEVKIRQAQNYQSGKAGGVQTAPQKKNTITRKQYDDYVSKHGEAEAQKYLKQYKVTVQ